jgi:hypothetical protein
LYESEGFRYLPGAPPGQLTMEREV